MVQLLFRAKIPVLLFTNNMLRHTLVQCPPLKLFSSVLRFKYQEYRYPRPSYTPISRLYYPGYLYVSIPVRLVSVVYC